MNDVWPYDGNHETPLEVQLDLAGVSIIKACHKRWSIKPQFVETPSIDIDDFLTEADEPIQFNGHRLKVPLHAVQEICNNKETSTETKLGQLEAWSIGFLNGDHQ